MQKKNTADRISIIHSIKQVIAKPSAWTCSCGYIITNKEATVSGYHTSSQGIHIHCSKCGKVIAQFVNPR